LYGETPEQDVEVKSPPVEENGIHSYSEMKVTLWGQRAAAFNTDGVYNSAEAKPILVLFVGGLMKSYQGILVFVFLIWLRPHATVLCRGLLCLLCMVFVF
jgi:hypothetical protein